VTGFCRRAGLSCRLSPTLNRTCVGRCSYQGFNACGRRGAVQRLNVVNDAGYCDRIQ